MEEMLIIDDFIEFAKLRNEPGFGILLNIHKTYPELFVDNPSLYVIFSFLIPDLKNMTLVQRNHTFRLVNINEKICNIVVTEMEEPYDSNWY